ncbi:hypothetical protein CDAR_285971 [Caerostris darwini]|uniref:Uncharacterized protein n=1 Tax=Caerostris darwini TaxID=1538125 RepID=A0AAV4N5G2_9ARAC|nr:hypothetical protein CDAR_285971 [Caerostris darwini]
MSNIDNTIGGACRYWQVLILLRLSVLNCRGIWATLFVLIFPSPNRKIFSYSKVDLYPIHIECGSSHFFHVWGFFSHRGWGSCRSTNATTFRSGIDEQEVCLRDKYQDIKVFVFLRLWA